MILSAEIAFLPCRLKARVGCQDKLCVSSNADETLAKWESWQVSEVLPHSCRIFILKVCYVTSGFWLLLRKDHDT